MERRDLLRSLLLAPFAKWFSRRLPDVDRRTWEYMPNGNLRFTDLPIPPSAYMFPYLEPPTSYVVSTLEHAGPWGYKDEKDPAGIKYVPQWTFSTKEEAEEFVRSLIPTIVSIEVKKQKGKDQIRSGYRGAVRVQLNGGIRSMQVGFVSRQKDGTHKPVLLDHVTWWDVQTAWAYLSNIRINGEPVSRPTRPGGSLSEYLVQPFVKGNPVITEVE